VRVSLLKIMFDSHLHLDDKAFDEDRKQVIERAFAAGVSTLINPGIDYLSTLKAIELAEQYENIYAGVGIHPHEAKSFEPHHLNQFKDLASNPKVIAVGEIGLDYHYNFSPPALRKKVFAAHLDLADELKLPVILHCREAFEDFYAILKVYPQLKGVMHCFSGDKAWAKKFLDLGFYFGVTGGITFKKADELREIIRVLPLDKLLVETDSPYLAPHPYRGKRNEPVYIQNIVQALAEIRKIDLEVLEKQLEANLSACFPKIRVKG
jgi:TatD DNase family protein